MQLALTTVVSALMLVLSVCFTPAQGGTILSHMFPRNIYDSQNNDPSHHLHQAAAASGSNPANPVSHLEWNSQLGSFSFSQQQQGGQNQEFRPYAHFALQDTHAHGVQPVFGQVHDAPPSPCRSRDRVYLPDMQSFLIKTPLTYQEAIQACIACGSELVLVDGTNVDRFREAFSSLGLYGDQRFWIKSWYDEQVEQQESCPAVLVNSMMGNRLEPAVENCQARLYALCF